MAVIGQSHLLWGSQVTDQISHSNTIVRIVPTEVVLCIIVSFLAHLCLIRMCFFPHTFSLYCIGSRMENPLSYYPYHKNNSFVFQHSTSHPT